MVEPFPATAGCTVQYVLYVCTYGDLSRTSTSCRLIVVPQSVHSIASVTRPLLESVPAGQDNVPKPEVPLWSTARDTIPLVRGGPSLTAFSHYNQRKSVARESGRDVFLRSTCRGASHRDTGRLSWPVQSSINTRYSSTTRSRHWTTVTAASASASAVPEDRSKQQLPLHSRARREINCTSEAARVESIHHRISSLNPESRKT